MPKSREPTRRPSRRLRCAIYTRKSSDEGLEQAFNSLDAQREACAAFVFSQKHEGWSLLPTLYDDGGYSGGTLDRPALQLLDNGNSAAFVSPDQTSTVIGALDRRRVVNVPVSFGALRTPWGS